VAANATATKAMRLDAGGQVIRAVQASTRPEPASRL
jgi:hypothetical protein